LLLLIVEASKAASQSSIQLEQQVLFAISAKRDTARLRSQVPLQTLLAANSHLL